MADLEQVGKLARVLMDEHGLTGWEFTWDRAVQRWGYCRRSKRIISMSRPLWTLVDDDAWEIQDTILHEIAHALSPGGHGPQWRATAVRIGAKPNRCKSIAGVDVTPKWRGECPQGHISTRHRRPGGTVSCGRCSSTWDARYKIVWTENS